MTGGITVIIPARGNGASIGACVESVLACACAEKEVIIIDDGLSQQSRSVLDTFGSRITVLASGGRGPSYARNLAASKTQAAYLAFTDSDCVVDANWLTALEHGFRMRPDAASVGGIQEPARDAGRFERDVLGFMRKAGFVAEYARCPREAAVLEEVEHNASCNVMYKREVFLKEGGFREGLWPGEDVDLDYRLRQHKNVLVCTSAAVVYHDKPRTYEQFRKMMFSYGRAQGELVRIHSRVFRKIQMLPLVVLVVGAALFVRPVFGVLVCLLLAATLAAHVRSRALFVLALNAFLFWNTGFFVGLVRGFLPEVRE
jgi:GT2 family glycosyltransferase